MTNWVDKKCKETVYITPDHILDCVRNYYDGIILCDPATEPSNPTKAEVFWTKEDDGLAQEWPSQIFINPPYGKVIQSWTKKIKEEADQGKTIIALMPCGARFSTRYWQNDILSPNLDTICFVKGRVKFLRPDGSVAKQNPYDSAIYGFNVCKRKFKKEFSKLGKCLEVKITQK